MFWIWLTVSLIYPYHQYRYLAVKMPHSLKTHSNTIIITTKVSHCSNKTLTLQHTTLSTSWLATILALSDCPYTQPFTFRDPYSTSQRRHTLLWINQPILAPESTWLIQTRIWTEFECYTSKLKFNSLLSHSEHSRVLLSYLYLAWYDQWICLAFVCYNTTESIYFINTCVIVNIFVCFIVSFTFDWCHFYIFKQE